MGITSPWDHKWSELQDSQHRLLWWKLYWKMAVWIRMLGRYHWNSKLQWLTPSRNIFLTHMKTRSGVQGWSGVYTIFSKPVMVLPSFHQISSTQQLPLIIQVSHILFLTFQHKESVGKAHTCPFTAQPEGGPHNPTHFSLTRTWSH